MTISTVAFVLYISGAFMAGVIITAMITFSKWWVPNPERIGLLEYRLEDYNWKGVVRVREVEQQSGYSKVVLYDAPEFFYSLGLKSAFPMWHRTDAITWDDQQKEES